MRTDCEEMDVFRDVAFTFNLITYITGTSLSDRKYPSLFLKIL